MTKSRDRLINQFIPKFDMAGAGAAAISAGGNLLSNLVNKIGSKKRYKRAKKDQYEMLDYQYAKNKEQWDIANKYDAPENQMRLLKEAGLNPHLVYGTGTASAGAAPSPNYGSGSVQREDQPNIDLGGSVNAGLAAFQDTRMRSAQIDQTRAVTEGIENKNAMNEIEKLILERKAEKLGIDVNNLREYSGDILKADLTYKQNRAAMALFEKNWQEKPWYEEARKKWEEKRGKDDNFIEFAESLMKEYPKLKEALAGSIDKIMDILGLLN